MEKIKITSFPRIHTTLIGMNRDGYRINGGVGFSISNPCLSISFEASSEMEIVDMRVRPFTVKEKEKIRCLLENTAKECGLIHKMKCVIEKGAPSHFGLGTTTAISMSCVEALFVLNSRQYSRQDIVKFSNRGGTSGIGINTYFNGGFVLDVGIKNDGRNLLPSSKQNTGDLKPLIIKQCELPKWEMGLCIPLFIKAKTEIEEEEFFKTNCPIGTNDVESILYEAVYGITSSILEHDYEIFCMSINTIQDTKWKLLERMIYGKDLISLEQRIRRLGADCVGMSSLGPLLYFTGVAIPQIITAIHQITSQVLCYKVSLNNKGRILEYD